MCPFSRCMCVCVNNIDIDSYIFINKQNGYLLILNILDFDPYKECLVMLEAASLY